MKTFDYYDYYAHCPLAVEVERLVNDCSNAKEHLAKVCNYFEENLKTPRELFEFITACIGYWSETEHYDERNKFAVWGSRAIAKQFPYVKTLCKKDDTLLNAYAFTMSAHRYLQNEFFKTILEYYKQKGDSLFEWWEEQGFVYGDTELIPYETYKQTKCI